MSEAAERGWRPGPGLLVTAAFIGPGTVMTASRAGAEFGFALVWTLAVAVAATILLQEMAARLGIVARLGLAEAIRESIRPATARGAAMALVLVAILFGNTAYQTGNLIGAGMGLSILSGLDARLGAGAIGLLVTVVLVLGGGRGRLQPALIIVVLAMSAAFVATACLSIAGVAERIAASRAAPLPDGAWLTALALVGTTVVPYNLFLHATEAQKRWPAATDASPAIRAARVDTVVAVALGGLVTLAILATAAAAFFGAERLPANAGELARQLEPTLGAFGRGLFAAGLAAAGLTSAFTAPLAAGYVAAGVFGTDSERVKRGAAVAVSLIGAVLAVTAGSAPQRAIVVAQAANGLLLPMVAAFLLWVLNRRDLVGAFRNSRLLNAAGIAMVVITSLLGAKGLSAIGRW